MRSRRKIRASQWCWRSCRSSMRRRAGRTPRARRTIGRRGETARCAPFEGRVRYRTLLDLRWSGRSKGRNVVDTASVGTVSRTEHAYQCAPGTVNQPGAIRSLPEADLLGHLDLDDLA